MKPIELILQRLELLESKHRRIQSDIEHIKKENARLQKLLAEKESDEKESDHISSGWWFY
jgi:hypothetical protein|tara:strand:+ start:198 stop:377 length:180 start_codon:yes stop_codon:yes gene_type:complete